MGRWTAASRCQQRSSTTSVNSSSCLARETGATNLVQDPQSQGLSTRIVSHSPSRVDADLQTADQVANAAEELLRASSLSEEQRSLWREISASVEQATPSPMDTKSGPPSPRVLAAMQAAKKAQSNFVEQLSPAQKKEVQQLMDFQKRERKLRGKEAARASKAEARSTPEPSPRAAVEGADLKGKQKEVMNRAFWLYQQDRQQREGSKYVDSTEWKRIRALGGENPTLRAYLKRAGWDLSWPWPQPEGRLLRREGQEAALARYAPKKAGG